MGTIKINKLSFQYDGMLHKLFDQFSLNIDESWRLGLIGRNGRGKTTFIKLLLGNLHYQGTIDTTVVFRAFPQEVSDPRQKTQDVLLTIAGLESSELWRIQVEMDQLRLSDQVLNRPFDTLSPGEQTKALLAALFTDERCFQLIDEPTNHLDVEARAVVADYLKHKRGFIVVSHDRHFINQVIDHVLSIDRAKIQLFAGNYDTWAAEYQRETQSEIEEKQQLQQEIKRLKSSAEQIEGWAKRAEAKTQKGRKSDLHARLDKGFLSHKAAKSMQRSQNTLKRTKSAIDEKQVLMKNVDTVVPLTMKDEQPHQVHLMQVNQIQVGREGRILNQPLSFDLKRGQRLVLSGANGLGKTTIFKALMGQRDLIVNGTILKSPSIKISYLSQDFETMCGSIQAYAVRFGIELNTFLNTLRKLGFERAAFDEDLGDLSMGQKRKISLARSLSEAANLYIWDEPLNYLDVITRQQIQDLILKHQPTMLIIDHDEAFIEAVKTGPLLKIQRFESN